MTEMKILQFFIMVCRPCYGLLTRHVIFIVFLLKNARTKGGNLMVKTSVDQEISLQRLRCHGSLEGGAAAAPGQWISHLLPGPGADGGKLNAKMEVAGISHLPPMEGRKLNAKTAVDQPS
jgi:hypothetical protein